MAKAYIDGEIKDVPEPKKKTINRPAPESVKKGKAKVSSESLPKRKITSATRGGGKTPKTAAPVKKAPRGFSRGGMGGAPKPVGGGGSALGALGGGIALSGTTELLHQLTPEGYGSKAGYGNEQSPRDFNTYQGALPFLGSFGAGVEKFAGDMGQVLGELSTYLPESMGGVKTADGNTVTLAPDQWKELKDEQYQGMFGQDQEGYGYLASGSEQPSYQPALPGATPFDPANIPDPQGTSPITFTPDGEVKANPRYGMPERPDMKRRELDERFGAITGGAIPESMEGFMVANFLQNQLRLDDSRRVGDSKDIYKADLQALPNFMQEDRLREMMPTEVAYKDAYAQQALANVANAPSERAWREAATGKLKAETRTMPTKEEALEQDFLKRASQDSATLAKVFFEQQGITDPSPEDLASIQNVIYNRQVEAYRQSKSGKKAKMTQRQEGDEGGWFSDPVPAIPYGVVYE